MKALVMDRSSRTVSLEDRPVPEPGPGEALVAVRQAGICGTDLEIVNGYMGFSGILGHEFVGRVEACADEAWTGRRVVGEVNLSCGTCGRCLRGLRRHCAQRRVLGIDGHDGALAEYLTLPIENLHAVPDSVGDEHAVFTEPLAAALEVLEQVEIRPSQDVLLLGDGRLAQLLAQVLLLTGCDLTACGKHASKLALLSRRGVRTVLLDDLSDDRYDVVVEATGSPSGPELAVRHCRPRGTIVLKSTVAASAGLPITPLVIDEIRVVGSRCGEFGPALRLLEQGRVDVASLVSGIYPIAKAREALEHARGREVLKVLVDMVHDR